MKLSEELKQTHDSGDCGKALQGYAERAENLELALAVARVHLQFIKDKAFNASRSELAGRADAALGLMGAE